MVPEQSSYGVKTTEGETLDGQEEKTGGEVAHGTGAQKDSCEEQEVCCEEKHGEESARGEAESCSKEDGRGEEAGCSIKIWSSAG